MSKQITIASNAIVAKLMTDDKTARQAVSKLLSYRVEGVEHMQMFQQGTWDGRTSLFSMLKNTFPAGFVFLVTNELKRLGYEIRLARKPLPAPLGYENPIVDEFGNDNPDYDYQMDTVRRLLAHGRMIAQVATGGGKSKIAKLAVARIRRTTLFLTTRAVLSEQMKVGFEDAQMKVGTIGEGDFNPIPGGVNCAMVQTLISRLEETSPENEARKIILRQGTAQKKEIEALKAKLKAAKVKLPEIHRQVAELMELQDKRDLGADKIAEIAKDKAELQQARRKKTIAFLETVEFVIGEEAHEAGGNSYYDILNHCPNAHYRLALTATPFMRDDAESNFRLHAAFGPIGIVVTEKMLIDRGILAKPYFRFVDLAAPARLFKSTPFQDAYSKGIVNHELRNKICIAYTKMGMRRGLTSMALVLRKEHGVKLEALARAAGIRAVFIQGESKTAARTAALKALATGEIDLLIGTNILDVGVDVPSVGIIFLMGGGKAEVAMRQRIGRGLRRKKTGPNVAFVVDFVDPVNTHLRTHARQRREIVERTPGFVEGILPANDDFPWALFDQDRAAAA